MSDPVKSDKLMVDLAISTSQAPKTVLKEIIDLGDMSPEDVAGALLQPVDMR